VYTIFRLVRGFRKIGWLLTFAVMILTALFGTLGFKLTTFDGVTPHTWADAAYKGISLLAIQTGSVPAKDNEFLELGRWLGMLFFASALITFTIKLFGESVERSVVSWFARKHVLLAGLGQNGIRLVERLAKKHTVVVLEGDREHPNVRACEAAGAIVLHGDPADAALLDLARLKRASHILALFQDESENVRVATSAFQLLQTQGKHHVKCVLRLTEPGLLDVVRRHRLKTATQDQITLEILNAHEIAATTMVREALVHSQSKKLNKLLILGLGTHHRLGEMIVLRAVKDHVIRHLSSGQLTEIKPEEKFVIHVFDKDAKRWLSCFKARYPMIETVCEITAKTCWARKHGWKGEAKNYDAAFVCISDMAPATIQAVSLRNDLLIKNQPIMVRVTHSESGFGGLIAQKDSGWGENIHPIGLEDPLYDPDTALDPEFELLARTIHIEYRKSQTDLTKDSNLPWQVLKEEYRKSSRAFERRTEEYLNQPSATTTGYDRIFEPDAFLSTNQVIKLNEKEIDSIAQNEHAAWCEERYNSGWRYGEVRDNEKKLNPLLQPWDKLKEVDKKYNLELAASIPMFYALADFRLVRKS
jgi:RyR domain/TrkA-N domain